MKLRNYISALLIACAALFAACTEDHEYQLGAPDSEDCWGVYFPSNQTSKISGSLELQPDDPTTLTYVAKRMNIDGALEVPVSISAADIFKVSSLVFPDGEDTATFTVEFPDAEIGTSYPFYLSIEDPNHYYTSNYGSGATFISFSLLRAKWIVCDEDKTIEYTDFVTGEVSTFKGYEWYTEDYITGFYGTDNVTYPVRVEVRADTVDEEYPYGPNGLAGLYRMVDPYKPDIYRYAGENGTSIYSDDTVYINIDATNPNAVSIDRQSIGLDWGYGEMLICDRAWYESRVGGDPSGWYGKIENGAIVFPKQGIMIWDDEGGNYANASGKFRLVINQDFVTDYTLLVSEGNSENGVIDLDITFGADVHKIRYAFYEGSLGEQAAATHAAALATGEEAYEELSDSGILSITLGSTGIYTFVAAIFNEEGTIVGRASHTFGYVAAGDNKDVDLTIGLDLTNKYKGYDTTNSAEFYGYGSDIQWAVWDIFDDKALEGAGDEDITEYLLELKAESAEADVPSSKVLTAAQLSSLNGQGLAFLIPDLIPGTHYTVYLLAYNGYNTTLFSADITTEGIPGPLDFWYTEDDFISEVSKEELFKEWNLWAVDYFGNSSRRENLGTWTFSENTTDDDEGFDAINLDGITLGILDTDTVVWEYDDGVIYQLDPGIIGQYGPYYLSTSVHNVANGYDYTGDYCLFGAMVDDGYLAIVNVYTEYVDTYNFNGIYIDAFKDSELEDYYGSFEFYGDIVLEDPAVATSASAAKVAKLTPTLKKLAKDMATPKNYVELRGRERMRALIDEIHQRSNSRSRTLKSSLKGGIIPVKADIPSRQAKAETTFTKGAHLQKDKGAKRKIMLASDLVPLR